MDARLATYKATLLAWNEKMNLIGPEARANLDEHIREALAAATILQPSGNVLDFGSGGGLPAIPMAIVSPDARFHMVESEQKKWAFLKHVVRECGLNAQVHGDRLANAVGRFPPELRFNLVVSRAVGSPEGWLPLLEAHLEDGAVIGLFQGGTDVPEIPRFKRSVVHQLPRGEANYLVTLTFHVEQ